MDEHSSRNIVLCIDGTWNASSPGHNTNVRKLFEDASFKLEGEKLQITYYIPGVGEDIRESHPGERVGLFGPELRRKAGIAPELPMLFNNGKTRNIFGGVFGKGTAARIKEAYAFLCAHYSRKRGDRVYIFGFSRGAYAARSLVGFLDKVGTIFAKDESTLRYVEEAYQAYESDTRPDNPMLVALLRKFDTKSVITSVDDVRSVPIHFLGLWDTVGALGIPRRRKRFKAERTEKYLELPPSVLLARHALALHELRRDFAPMLWCEGRFAHNVKQVWFPGAHADVGGGYSTEESGFSDAALRWMANEAKGRGMHFDKFGDWWSSSRERILHHEVKWWFVWTTPQVREVLEKIDETQLDSVGVYANARYFHQSTRQYLQSRIAPEALKHKGWRPKIGKCLAAIDTITVRLCINSMLYGYLLSIE